MIAESFQSDAGFIYFYDENAETLKLRAYAGDAAPDNPDPQLGIRAGVVGAVFHTQRAQRDATVRDDPGLPRSELPGFIAAPVSRGPKHLGVLLLQRGSSGTFSAEDERALRAIANPLAATLENAIMLREIPLSQAREGSRRAAHHPVRKGSAARVLHGRTASEGTALGRAFILEQGRLDEPPGSAATRGDAHAALRAFDDAVERTRHQLEELQHQTETDLSDVASLIFNSHLLMLGDESFIGEMRRMIRSNTEPEHAVYQVVRYFAETFGEMEDPRFQEKVQDVQDVGHRLMSNLQNRESGDTDYTGYVVVARHVFPSELVKLAVQRVEGIVFHGTGVTAHVAILSRSLGLPVLLVDDPSILAVRPGTHLIVNATDGQVFIDPSSEVRRDFEARDRARLAATSRTPPDESCSGCSEPVQVLANVNILQDVHAAVEHGAEGIGLYRSEFPFIIRNAAPTEDEQLHIYRRILDKMAALETVLRTADIGGDKLMDAAYQPEQNPFLGVRGIRFSLANAELFRDQLRAMLRAGADSDLRIMFPMVSSVEEVEAGRSEVEACIDALRREGIPHNPAPKIGAMVELPSAVESIAELAEATDFLSVGTNDLVMYLLAVDRTNERLGSLYRNYHPAVLRAMKRIVDGVGDKLSALSLCGDSAADPTLIPFFIGIGIRKLSVAPRRIPEVRRRIAGISLDDAQRISTEMLSIRAIREMEQYLASLGAGGKHGAEAETG